MVKVRCPKCGTIFPLESADIQICPTCGCRLRVSRRSAEPAARYSSRQWGDPYKQQTPRLPERGGGVYLSREEYENLIYKARMPRRTDDDRRDYVDRPDYRDYNREKIGPDYTKAEYGTPSEVYNYRSFGDDASPDQPAPAPVTPEQPVQAEEKTPAPEAVKEPVSAPAPAEVPFEQKAVASEGSDYGSVPVYDNGITPSPEPHYTTYDEAYSGGSVGVKKRNAKPFNVITFLVVFATLVMNGLLLILPMMADNASTGINLIKIGVIVEKIIVIAAIALPVLFSLLGLIATGKGVKGLKIFTGIFMVLISAFTLYYLMIIAVAEGTVFSTDLIISMLTASSVWIYIASSLSFVSAVLLFVSAGVTPKKQKNR